MDPVINNSKSTSKTSSTVVKNFVIPTARIKPGMPYPKDRKTLMFD